MPKLQQIKRTNGSIVSSVNIPLEIIELLGWEKGNSLAIEVDMVDQKNPKIVICKEEY